MQSAYPKAQSRPYVIGGASLEDSLEATDREEYYSPHDDFFDQRQKLDADPFLKTEKRTFMGSLDFKKNEDLTADVTSTPSTSSENVFSSDFAAQTEPVSLPDVGGKVAHGAMEGMQFIMAATPDIKLVTNTVKETTGAVGDLLMKDVLNMQDLFGSGSAKKEHSNPADDVKKEQAKAKIREIMAQYEQDKMRIEVQKQEEAQKAMERMGVTHQDILATKGAQSNVNYEGYLTIANVILADLSKSWAKVKQMLSQSISSSAKGKSGDLSMHSGAQEGQSMVSSSGSIASAG